MNDLGKITITKNKDCDNKTYYSAYIYGIDAVIGGGDTRNEAKDELFGNIVFYVNYLIETNQKLKQQLEEKDKLLKCYQEEEKLISDILGDKDLTIIGSRVHLKNLIVELKNKIKDKDIVIEEKDKEIESYKNKAYIDMLYKESLELKLDNQTQLAIQELEKVKNKCNGMYELWLDSNYKENMYNNEDIAGVFEDISVFTNDLIKKLKGEKE